MEAPFDEDRMIGADGKEQEPQGKNQQNQDTDGGKQPAAAREKGRREQRRFRDRNGGKNGGSEIFRKVVTAMDHVL